MPQFRDTGIKRHRGGLGDVIMALGVAAQYAKEKRKRSRSLLSSFLKRRDPAPAGVTLGCPRELVSLGENVPGVEVLPCRPTDDTAATPGAFDRITFGRLYEHKV